MLKDEWTMFSGEVGHLFPALHLPFHILQMICEDKLTDLEGKIAMK